jgi:uncharacterized membrane protein YkvA (DUF1232 family)
MAAPEQLEKMKAWIDSYAADVAAVQALVANEKIPKDARLVGAAALNYLVTRLDLIPDWEETCGILDDAMILRVAMAEAAEKDLDALDGEAHRGVAKLANEVELVREFLGSELYPRLKHYVQELGTAVVRNRLPRVIVDDPAERGRLYAEIKDELKRVPPAPMKEPERIARIIRNYLSQKLK